MADFIPLENVKKYDRFKYQGDIIEATKLRLGSGYKIFKALQSGDNFDEDEIFVFSFAGWRKRWDKGDITPLEPTGTNPAILELLKDMKRDDLMEKLFDSLMVLYAHDSSEGQKETIKLLMKVLPKKFRSQLSPPCKICDCNPL
jgi:hypothetical protein